MKRKKCCACMVPTLMVFCLLFVWRERWIYYVLSADQHVSFNEKINKELNLMIHSGQSEKIPKVGYNIVNSRNVGAMRTLPNTRHESCTTSSNLAVHLHARIPKISFVVTVDQAERSVLARNILSAIYNAEPLMVFDMVLVLDGVFDTILENYFMNIPRVTVIKNEHTKGRAMSRMQGVAAVRGEIIVFIDSLTEMNVDWLSPLVLRIIESPKSVVLPVYDVIDHMTFKYYSLAELYRLGFDWSLKSHLEQFSSPYVIDSNPVTVFRTPLMSGNVFAMRRDFFLWLGQYETSFLEHSMDDLELSLRIWLCGGLIEIVPCSRVGVVNIRSSDSHASFNNYLRSAKRVAEVWLDEYKRFFYAVRPSARMQPIADISSMRKAKEKLKCWNFKWYLTNIYPQLQPLVTDELAFGNIRQGEYCLDLDPGQLPLIAKLRQCENEKNSQEWSWRNTGNIVSNGMCLTSNLIDMRTFVLVNFCKDLDNNQIWYRHEEKIVHMDTNLCLDAQHATTGLIISDCIKGKASQAWIISTEQSSEVNI